MLRSILDDIKQEFGYGNMIKRIIIVNLAVYVVINLAWVFLSGVTPGFYESLVHFFAMPSSGWGLLTHPWAPLTHMFLHEGFWHIVWNMLFLFWFGRIFGDLLGDKRVLPLYLLGGFAGALLYFLVANLGFIPTATHALGASAAVMAILVATGVFAPNYGINLLFIGEVKLKWIVFALVFMNILGTKGTTNAGGSWGHLGGIAMGFLYAIQLQKGNDLALPIQRIIAKISHLFTQLLAGSSTAARPGPKATYRRGEPVKTGRNQGSQQPPKRSSAGTTTQLTYQEQLDAILDKIKATGYESLSQAEKDFLFRASKS